MESDLPKFVIVCCDVDGTVRDTPSVCFEDDEELQAALVFTREEFADKYINSCATDCQRKRLSAHELVTHLDSWIEGGVHHAVIDYDGGSRENANIRPIAALQTRLSKSR